MSPLDTTPASYKSDAIEKSWHQAIAYIKGTQNNGWWPYTQSNQHPATEATAWCALALSTAEPNSGPLIKTSEFFLTTQNNDGGWCSEPTMGSSEWGTGPALLALRLLNYDSAQSGFAKVAKAEKKAYSFLFEMRTEYYRPVARLLLLLAQGEKAMHYGRGWPWMKDCAHWVEPTTYSLLALKLPALPGPEVLQAAAHHADIFFYEHECQGGGWNHGAHRCLGVDLPPYTVTTAEALLALQDNPGQPCIERGLNFLLKNNYDSHTPMALAWSVLALHAYKRNYREKIMELLQHQNPDGSFGLNNMVTGIATLSLAADQKTNILLNKNRT